MEKGTCFSEHTKMNKNDKIHIAISTDEKLKLKRRANSLGMSLSQYCTFILTQAKPKIEFIDKNT